MRRATFIVAIIIGTGLISSAVIFAQNKSDLADFAILSDLLKTITDLTNQITGLREKIKTTEGEVVKARFAIAPSQTTDRSAIAVTVAIPPTVVGTPSTPATLVVKLSSGSPLVDLPVIAGMGSFSVAAFDLANNDKDNIIYISTISLNCVECQKETRPITSIRIYNGSELAGSLSGNVTSSFIWKFPPGDLTIKKSGITTLTIVADFDAKGGNPDTARKIVFELSDLKASILNGKAVTVGTLPLTANSISLFVPGGVVGTTNDPLFISSSYCAVKSDAAKIDLTNETEVGLTKKAIIGSTKSIDQLKRECFYNDIPTNAYCAKSANLKIPYRRLALFVDKKGAIMADCLQAGCDLIRCPTASASDSRLANIFSSLMNTLQQLILPFTP